MPGRRYGFECELSSGARATIAELARMGIARTDSLHGYHCGCEDCRPNDVEAEGGPLFRGQQDCTVDGEIIASILTHNTENSDRAFEGLATALLKTRADVSEDAGFHVHVDKRDLDAVAKLRLYRMYLRYQDSLAELASTRFSGVRSYNTKVRLASFIPYLNERTYNPATGSAVYRLNRPLMWQNCNGRRDDEPCCRYCNTHRAEVNRRTALDQAFWDTTFGPDREAAQSPASPEERFWTDDTFIPNDPPKGMWLNGVGAGGGSAGTFEFRLWNATRVEWRMRLAVGVSVAMVDAAKAGVNVTREDERPLEEVIDPYLTDDTWSAIIRQRSFKDVA